MSVLRVLVIVARLGLLAAYVMAGVSPGEEPVTDRIEMQP